MHIRQLMSNLARKCNLLGEPLDELLRDSPWVSDDDFDNDSEISLRTTIDLLFESSLGNSLRDSIKRSLRDSLWSSLWESPYEFLNGSLRYSLHTSIDDSLRNYSSRIFHEQ